LFLFFENRVGLFERRKKLFEESSVVEVIRGAFNIFVDEGVQLKE
jgi:hypothetical protein